MHLRNYRSNQVKQISSLQDFSVLIFRSCSKTPPRKYNMKRIPYIHDHGKFSLQIISSNLCFMEHTWETPTFIPVTALYRCLGSQTEHWGVCGGLNNWGPGSNPEQVNQNL